MSEKTYGFLPWAFSTSHEGKRKTMGPGGKRQNECWKEWLETRGRFLNDSGKDSWTMKQKTQTVSSRVFRRYRNSNILSGPPGPTSFCTLLPSFLSDVLVFSSHND